MLQLLCAINVENTGTKGTKPLEGTKSEPILVQFLLNVLSKVLTQTIVQKSLSGCIRRKELETKVIKLLK